MVAGLVSTPPALELLELDLRHSILFVYKNSSMSLTILGEKHGSTRMMHSLLSLKVETRCPMELSPAVFRKRALK
jgi:hypothetical protein